MTSDILPSSLSPPMTDEIAKAILQKVTDLGGATTIITTDRLMIGKLSDRLRIMTVILEIIVAIIGGLSGLCGAVMVPLDIQIPSSVVTMFFVLSGLASGGALAIPKLIDFVKRFSGRSFWDEYPRWLKVRERFNDPKSLGDIQISVLSMFSFVRAVNDFKEDEPRRCQVKALNHLLSVLQCSQSMDQFREA